MTQRSRILFPGCPYHVTVRGFQHRRVFQDSDDCRTFIRLLDPEIRRQQNSVWVWALMSNHIHLILVPDLASSIQDAMEESLDAYSEAFHVRHGLAGPLWQDRIYAAVLDRQEVLWKAVRYVERNPVEAGLVQRAEDYPWSSAAYHCGRRTHDPLVAQDSPLRDAISDWSGWLDMPERVPTGSRAAKRVTRMTYRR